MPDVQQYTINGILIVQCVLLADNWTHSNTELGDWVIGVQDNDVILVSMGA